MKREDVSLIFLAILAVVALALLLIFPDIISKVIQIVGTLICCFMLVVAVIAVLGVIFAFFSVPFVAVKNPSKQYYSNYRVEDVKGMDEVDDNKKRDL